MASRQSPHGVSDTTVGNYRIGSEIGRGSFAVVYKGHNVKNKSLAAVKVVQLQKLSRKLLENLESEIQILKKLNHPHIVALHDCRKNEKNINIIMEYCSVGDLSVVIKKRDRLASLHPSLEPMVRDYPPPPGGGLHEVVVRHFLKQLASALEYLRKDGLVHRDVKPQNLLLNPPPNWDSDESIGPEGSISLAGLSSLPVLKLADFGFARVLPNASMAETLCGSPLYMAPEILRYEKYDATADLWSVGTVLYEMIVGKPPFRAPNHVELLRKIEARNDRIDFPSSCVASDEVRGLVKALLKRNPLERMSFEEFFAHSVIVNEIPGAAVSKASSEQKLPETPRPEDAVRRTPSVTKATDQRALGVEREERNRAAGSPPLTSSPRVRQAVESSALPFAHPTSSPVGTPPRLTDLRRATAQPNAVPQVSPVRERPMTRPGIATHATAPAGRDLIPERRTAAAMDRIGSQNSHPSPSNSFLLQQQREQDREYQREQETLKERRGIHSRGKNSRELRDSVDDYVFIDKQQVQINAFADEIGTVRRGLTTPPLSATNALVRKLSSGSNSSTRQVARRPDYGNHTKGSFERRYGSSPASAKSALAKALELANLRLFGVSLSPPNQSPPNMHYQFPSYPNPGSVVMVGNGGGIAEEDMIAVQTIEEAASRSDVVYNFAEVKYAQLMPTVRRSTPAPQGLGLISQEENTEASEDASVEMVPDAIVQTAEEAMVLYVKALSLLAKAMDIAGAWWAATNNRNEPMNIQRNAASGRMNNCVQWIRERFNDVLEKAENVRMKQVEAQKELPTSHPSHPNNRSDEGEGSGWSNFALTTGVSAERLMYDRALEMSRASAVNELIGDDLPGCEIAYVTSLRLLEAVLETDPNHSDEEGKMDDDDRHVVENFLGVIRHRLSALRKKMVGLSKRSSVHSAHSAHGSPQLRQSPSPVNFSSSPTAK